MKKWVPNMSIADFKAKVVSIAQSGNDHSSLTKKLEVMSANFKATPTIIARDLKIVGELSGSGVIEIEGSVDGTISGNIVILRENGTIRGTVLAESLNIRGKFEGVIKAKSVSIASKAVVSGDIEYDSLSVEDGACIDGQFKYLSSSSAVGNSKIKG